MKHTMRSVMQALERAKADGGLPLPVMTSNQCHALAQELNKRLREGGQVTRGELERLEEFKRQVRENRR